MRYDNAICKCERHLIILYRMKNEDDPLKNLVGGRYKDWRMTKLIWKNRIEDWYEGVGTL